MPPPRCCLPPALTKLLLVKGPRGTYSQRCRSRALQSFTRTCGTRWAGCERVGGWQAKAHPDHVAPPPPPPPPPHTHTHPHPHTPTPTHTPPPHTQAPSEGTQPLTHQPKYVVSGAVDRDGGAQLVAWADEAALVEPGQEEVEEGGGAREVEEEGEAERRVGGVGRGSRLAKTGDGQAVRICCASLLPLRFRAQSTQPY